jgi:hypothetical protein
MGNRLEGENKRTNENRRQFFVWPNYSRKILALGTFWEPTLRWLVGFFVLPFSGWYFGVLPTFALICISIVIYILFNGHGNCQSGRD